MRAPARGLLALACSLALACGHGDDDAGGHDAAGADGAGGDGDGGSDATPADGPAADAVVIDARLVDAATDAATDAAIDGPPPIITGGPCLSGAPGATAYRIRWTNGGGTAVVSYEVNGLPDHTRDHAGAFGYQIGFTPRYVDTALAGGGLLLDGSDFVDLELTTAGLGAIGLATLSLHGRSYHTTASGSFSWQTFDGVGATATNTVSNTTPYRWYSADMTGELSPGDSGVLIRIKAGPSSGSLVVDRIELCLQAS